MDFVFFGETHSEQLEDDLIEVIARGEINGRKMAATFLIAPELLGDDAFLKIVSDLTRSAAIDLLEKG